MKNMIEVKHYSKSFGSKVTHRDVSFEVTEGECLGLIGGSGTGKSVLLRSLIGLEKPSGGQVLIEGQAIEHLKENELVEVRKKVAYAFQGGALFDSMTVFENLAYPLKEHSGLSKSEITNRVLNILNDFGLPGTEDLLPSSLSGGMQKRVGLARAIIMNPRVILYDEPTAGLDPSNTKMISELILRLKKKGITSILVTHDMPVAFQVCDRIAMLEKGLLTHVGRPSEIISSKTHPIRRFSDGEI